MVQSLNHPLPEDLPGVSPIVPFNVCLCVHQQRHMGWDVSSHGNGEEAEENKLIRIYAVSHLNFQTAPSAAYEIWRQHCDHLSGSFDCLLDVVSHINPTNKVTVMNAKLKLVLIFQLLEQREMNPDSVWFFTAIDYKSIKVKVVSDLILLVAANAQSLLGNIEEMPNGPTFLVEHNWK